MARVVIGGIFTDINGSVGGWTFQNTASGKAVRLKPANYRKPPFYPFSTRTYPSALRKYWEGLTPAERDDWNTFAAANAFTDIFGNVKTITGYQYFFSCVGHQLSVQNVVSTLAPSPFVASDVLEDFTVDFTTSELLVDFGANINHPDHTLVIYATLPMANESLSNRRFWRLVAYSQNPNYDAYDIFNQYQTRFSADLSDIHSTGRVFIGVRAFLIVSATGITSVAKQSYDTNF